MKILLLGEHGQVSRELQLSLAGQGELIVRGSAKLDLAQPEQIRRQVRDADDIAYFDALIDTLVREHGADEVVVYPRAPLDKDQSKALAEAFKAACGANGADVIYDIIGGDYSEPAVRSIAWEGRFCVVGFTAGIAKLPLNLTLLKSCDVCGVFWGGFFARDPDRHRRHVSQLLDWWAHCAAPSA